MQRSLASSLTILFVVAVILAGVAPVVTAQEVIGRPDLEVSSANEPFVPGQEASLDVSVLNSGQIDHNGPTSAEERVTTARGATMTVHSGETPIEVKTGTVALGNIPVGVQETPIAIEISRDAKPGTYRLPVTLSYSFTRLVDLDPGDRFNAEFKRTERKYITVRVENRAQFEIVDRRSDVLVGDRGSMTLTVKNIGTRSARDTSLQVQSQSDEVTFGTGSPSSTAHTGRVAPGETATVDYTVAVADNATIRNYSLTALASFDDRKGIRRESTELVTSLRPRPEQSVELTSLDGALRIGQEGTLNGTLVNRGPEPMDNPVVVFEPTSENVDVDQREYALGDLDVGERAPFSFTVDVSESASKSVQQFDLRVRYRKPNGDRRRSDQLDARVELLEERDQFVVEPVNATASVGSTTSFRLVVRNNGERTVRNVQGKAFFDTPLSSEDDTVFVESLRPGESTEVVVEVQVTGEALPKMYSFAMDFQYDLPDGDTKLSKSYRIPVSATEQEQQGGPIGLLEGGIALAVLVLGAGAIVWWRRR